MAKDDDNSTAPADQPSSTPGNPHFLGRHTSAAHNLLPTMRQDTYPTPREAILDFGRMVCETAYSSRVRVAEDGRENLKGRPEQLDAALNALLGELDEDGQFHLSTALLVAFLVGKHGDPLTGPQLKQWGDVNDSRLEERKRGRELALKRAAEVRKAHPQKYKSNSSMAKHITPWVTAEMRKLYRDDYAVSVRTVRGWLAEK